MEIDLMSTAEVRHRSPALAQAVSAPLTRAAIFLVATFNSGAENRAILRSFCGDLAKLVRAVEFRDLEGIEDQGAGDQTVAAEFSSPPAA